MKNYTVYKNKRGKTFKQIIRNRWVYAMMLPVVIYFVMFRYVPIYYLRMVFYDYKILKGFEGSKFVGLEWFEKFFSSGNFGMLLKNTVMYSLGAVFLETLFPIIFALLINEVRNKRTKKVYQTLSFAPYFISTVIVVTMINNVISPSVGVLNSFREMLGMESIYYLGDPKYFYVINYVSGVWSIMGWNAVVYISALSGVDSALYEAAMVDGASRWQRLIYITIPSIKPTIAIMMILSIGKLVAGGNVEKLLLLQNDLNYSVSEMLNTYSYKLGIVDARYSYSTAISFWTSCVSFILVLISNRIVNRMSDSDTNVF